LDVKASRAAQMLDLTGEAMDPPLALRAIEPAGQTKWGDAAVIGEQGPGEGREKLQPPDGTVTAAMRAGTPRAFTHRELAQPHRKFSLENLRVGQARIGHVGLDRVAAVEVRPRAGAACNGFVVLNALIAECQVVHRSLGGGQHPERTVKGIHDAL